MSGDPQSKERAAAGAEDAALVTRTLDGDEQSFDQLVKRYERRAVAVAYRLLNDLHDAAEVAQDAFVRAIRNLESLEDRARFGPWLLRIVSNLSLNFRRKRRLRLAAPIDDLEESVGLSRSASGALLGDDGKAGEAEADELSNAIQSALKELPDKQRLALVLFSVEGMAQKEVAEIMECSVELVKWNVFQARKRMRELLSDYMTE
jgi:RNA polymerase sigma-70 factor (ECF subfamily)